MATTSQQVINNAFLQALGRPADPSGLEFYTSQLEAGRSVGDILADLNYAAATGVEDKAANQAITAAGGWDFAPPPPPSGGGGGSAAAPAAQVTPLTAQDLYNQFLSGRPALEKDLKFWNDYIAQYGPDQAMAAFDAAAQEERNMDLAARAASLREQNLIRENVITAQDLYNEFLGGRSALQSDLDYWNNYIAVYGPEQARAAFDAAAQPEKEMPVEKRVESLREQGLTVPGSLLGEFATQRKATPNEVRGMYLSMLGREPDTEGYAYWTTQPVENLRQRFYEASVPEMTKRVAEIPVTTTIPKPLMGAKPPGAPDVRTVNIPGQYLTTNYGEPQPLTVDISTMPTEQRDLTNLIVGRMPRPTIAGAGPMFTPSEVNAQLELERLRLQPTPTAPVEETPVAGFAQGGLVGNDINQLLRNQQSAIQRESQSRQMLNTLGAPPVKKFSDGGPAGSSSSGVRRLKMSGYQDGGEVTPVLTPEQLDEFNRNMQRELDEENRQFQESGGQEFYSAIRPAMEDINERVKQTLELYRMGRATEADVRKLIPSMSEWEIASQFGRTDTGGYRLRDIDAPSKDRLRDFIEIQKPTIDTSRPDMFPYDPRGSKAQERVLKMSEGGDVSNDAFIHEMMTGTLPTDQESPVDKKASELLRALSEGTRGFVGADPIEPGSEAYRTGQALANMPVVGAVAATAKGTGKAAKGVTDFIKNAEGSPLVVYRGLILGENTPSKALKGKSREGYASFGSSSPYVAASYGTPSVDEAEKLAGTITPLLIKASRVIEFPVTTNRYGSRQFDKFEFDRRAQALKPGEVLVARDVVDIGPRASTSVDPEKLYSYGSDIYAWGPETKTVSAITKKAAGGEVTNFIKRQAGSPPQGEMSDDAAMMEMFTGTLPEAQGPSPVDTAVSDFISSRSKLVTDPQEFFRVMGENLETYHGKPLREDPEKYLMEQLGPGVLGGIIKPKGGNVVTQDLMESLKSLRPSVLYEGYRPASEADKLLREQMKKEEESGRGVSAVTRRIFEENKPKAALDEWVQSKLGRYIRTEMGSEEDPVRKLGEEMTEKIRSNYETGLKRIAKMKEKIAEAKALGKNTDISEAELADEINRVENAYRQTSRLPVNQGPYLYPRARTGEARKKAGFSPYPISKSSAGKEWEETADSLFQVHRAGDLVEANSPIYQDNPWIAKLDPDEIIYNPQHVNEPSMFTHTLDELENALNPSSGLPQNLLLKPEDMQQLSIDKAFRHVNKINDWRMQQRTAANLEEAQRAAVTYKEYPGSTGKLKWQELKAPEYTELPSGYRVEDMDYATAMLKDAQGNILTYLNKMDDKGAVDPLKQALSFLSKNDLERALKYEGSTMRHCVGKYCDPVFLGQTRIFSLRDSKGEPHITIETAPPQTTSKTIDQFFRENPSLKRAEGLDDFQYANSPAFPWEEYNQWLKSQPEEVRQVKGKGNEKPSARYIEFGQDFIASKNWSDIQDLENLDIVPLKPMMLKNAQERGFNPQILTTVRDQPYITKKEFNRLADLFGGMNKYAAGGEVTDFIKRAA